MTPAELRALMATAEYHPGETTEQLRARAHAEGMLQSWRAWLPGLLDKTEREHMRLALLAANGAPVLQQLNAEEQDALIDFIRSQRPPSISPITPASQADGGAPAAIRSLPAGAHSSEVSQ